MEWNEIDIAFESGETQDTWDQRQTQRVLDELFDSPEFQAFNDAMMEWVFKYVLRKRTTEEIIEEWRIDPV